MEPLLFEILVGGNFFGILDFFLLKSRVSDPDPAFFLIADPDPGSGSRV
jgi:hypothetical protein